MPDTNYYELLGVKKEATDQEITQAWRKLALERHPDKAKQNGLDPGEADALFKKLIEAYSTLHDPIKRCRYDSSLPDQSIFGSSSQGAPAPTFFSPRREPPPVAPSVYPIKLRDEWIDLLSSDDVTSFDAFLNKQRYHDHRVLLGTFLYQACTMGKRKIAVYLIENKNVSPELNISDGESITGTIFKAAAQGGNLELVRYLNEIHHVNIESRGQSLEPTTALSQAARYGHTDVMHYLIAHGANVNPDLAYHNILREAIMSQKPSAVELLLNHGTIIQDKDLDYAFREGNLEVVQVILQKLPTLAKHSFIKTPAYAAIYSGNVQLVRYLEAKESLDLFALGRDGNINTIYLQLIEAAGLSGNLDMMRYLLEEKQLIKLFTRTEIQEKLSYTALESSLGQELGKQISTEEVLKLLRYLMEVQQIQLSPVQLKSFLDEKLQSVDIRINAYFQTYVTSHSVEYRGLLQRIVVYGLTGLEMSDLVWARQVKIPKNKFDDYDREIAVEIQRRKFSQDDILKSARDCCDLLTAAGTEPDDQELADQSGMGQRLN